MNDSQRTQVRLLNHRLGEINPELELINNEIIVKKNAISVLKGLGMDTRIDTLKVEILALKINQRVLQKEHDEIMKVATNILVEAKQRQSKRMYIVKID
jgi:hypothetical protein